MRVAVRHHTRYSYGSPAKFVLQLLRMTPRNHDGQTVKSWRIVPNCDAILKGGEDPFGNLTHTLSLPGPISEIGMDVEGGVTIPARHGSRFAKNSPLPAINACFGEAPDGHGQQHRCDR